MNTFYIYTLNLAQYERLMEEELMSEDSRQLHLNQHLLISGTNRRIITDILRLHQQHALTKGKPDPTHQPDMQHFGMKYHQMQSLLQDEVRMAAGHFSHTIHRVNLAAFYHLSFQLARELTVVLLKNELPDGALDRQSWEGVPPASGLSRFYAVGEFGE